MADSVEETILDLNAAKRDSLLQHADGAATDVAPPSAPEGQGEDEDEASARRWDVEGVEIGVLSSLTDSLLSPRRAPSPLTAVEPGGER